MITDEEGHEQCGHQGRGVPGRLDGDATEDPHGDRSEQKTTSGWVSSSERIRMIDNTPKRPSPTPALTSALASAVATAITPMLIPSSATTMSPLLAGKYSPKASSKTATRSIARSAPVLIGVTFPGSVAGDADELKDVPEERHHRAEERQGAGDVGRNRNSRMIVWVW